MSNAVGTGGVPVWRAQPMRPTIARVIAQASEPRDFVELGGTHPVPHHRNGRRHLPDESENRSGLEDHLASVGAWLKRGITGTPPVPPPYTHAPELEVAKPQALVDRPASRDTWSRTSERPFVAGISAIVAIRRLGPPIRVGAAGWKPYVCCMFAKRLARRREGYSGAATH